MRESCLEKFVPSIGFGYEKDEMSERGAEISGRKAFPLDTYLWMAIWSGDACNFIKNSILCKLIRHVMQVPMFTHS